MVEMKLDSGSEAVIRPASFQKAMWLRKTIVAELKNADTDIDIDVKNIDGASLIEKLPKLVFAVDSSEKVEKAMFSCLSYCTRNGEKITGQTFDDPDAWEDYYPIVIECLKENMRPFIKGLVSALNTTNLASATPQE